MNWDRIEGNWKQFTGKVKEQWGKLTDDDIDRMAGQREQSGGKVQESAGAARDEAEQRVDDWSRRRMWGCLDVTRGRRANGWPTARCIKTSLHQATRPVVDLLLGLVAGNAVVLLDLADELLALTRHAIDVVVSELAPLFLDLAGELLPVAFDTVPIHC
jgi:uncharacterized protein YjbJ (UPF0337 family)